MSLSRTIGGTRFEETFTKMKISTINRIMDSKNYIKVLQNHQMGQNKRTEDTFGIFLAYNMDQF